MALNKSSRQKRDPFSATWLRRNEMFADRGPIQLEGFEMVQEPDGESRNKQTDLAALNISTTWH